MIKRFVNKIKTDGWLRASKSSIRSLFMGSFSSQVDEVKLVYRILKNRPSSGSVMIDVGGHYGESIRDFALDGWIIYTFEPDKENLKILLRKYGRLSNVKVDSRGVSNHKETNASFYRSSVSSGISGLSKFHESHTLSDSIELTTLTDYCHDNNISAITFLKIDTEGFDLFVLQGFPWTQMKPEVIVCEFEDKKTVPLGYSYKELGEFLVKKGYHVMLSEWYPIVSYGGRHQWCALKRFPAELESQSAWGNFIAFSSVELRDEFISLIDDNC